MPICHCPSTQNNRKCRSNPRDSAGRNCRAGQSSRADAAAGDLSSSSTQTIVRAGRIGNNKGTSSGRRGIDMYELKTKETDVSVIEFIESVDHPKKREDAYRLLDIFTEVTGYEAKMWGPSLCVPALNAVSLFEYPPLFGYPRLMSLHPK